jgi:hypothetical protein
LMIGIKTSFSGDKLRLIGILFTSYQDFDFGILNA